MDTALSYLRQLPESKKEQLNFANQIIEAVQSGEVNALETEVFLKALSNVLTIVGKHYAYKECVQDEADKYAEKTFIFRDVTFTKSQRSTFDYKGDSVWAGLKKLVTDREAFLKNIPEGLEVADPETGEIITRPPVKKTSIISIRF